MTTYQAATVAIVIGKGSQINNLHLMMSDTGPGPPYCLSLTLSVYVLSGIRLSSTTLFSHSDVAVIPHLTKDVENFHTSFKQPAIIFPILLPYFGHA